MNTYWLCAVAHSAKVSCRDVDTNVKGNQMSFIAAACHVTYLQNLGANFYRWNAQSLPLELWSSRIYRLTWFWHALRAISPNSDSHEIIAINSDPSPSLDLSNVISYATLQSQLRFFEILISYRLFFMECPLIFALMDCKMEGIHVLYQPSALAHLQQTQYKSSYLNNAPLPPWGHSG